MSMRTAASKCTLGVRQPLHDVQYDADVAMQILYVLLREDRSRHFSATAIARLPSTTSEDAIGGARA